MSEVNAEALIQKRKDLNGNVNRKFLAKIEYSVMNLKNQNDPNYLVLYIHKISIYDGSGILQSITPDVDYFDKVNGLKLRDGKDKIFFDKNWKEIEKEDSTSASYYRIVNYQDGKIVNPVIDYFISGKPQMKGNYIVNLQTMNGLFQWYYENGQKSEEVNYINGNKNGTYNSWYQNGNIKEEVNYNYGKIADGCYKIWAEDGRCLARTLGLKGWSYSDHFSYYENGENKYSYKDDKKCPCISSNGEALSKTKNNSNNNSTQITMSDLAGTYNGISESAGSTITVSSNGNIALNINGNRFAGTATILNTKEKDHESVKRLIKNKLNKDVEVTGYDFRITFTSSGQTKHAPFSMLKNDESIILYGGGNAFFEKKR